MNSKINSIWLDWRDKVPSGVPNPSNDYHLALLKEVCLNSGIDQKIIDNAILFLEKDDDKYQSVGYGKYKLKKDIGPDGKGKEGSPTFEKDDTGNYVKVGEEDGEEDKEDKATSISGPDISTDSFAEKGLTGKSDDEEDEPKSKEDKPKGTPTKPFSSKTQENHKNYVNGAKKIRDAEEDEDRKKGITVLVENWEKFVNAKTEEDKIEAIEALIDYNLIERNQWSEKSKGKIYISSNAMGIPYKHFMGGKQGDAVTEDINRIIRQQGLDVNMRNNSADRALADLSGKHNEAGVVALLDPSKENQKAYNENREKYRELGNDDSEAHQQNVDAVKLIKDSLPEGSEIKKSIQVGGIGSKKLMDLYGIDEKVDPTDMIVVYDDNGVEKVMKISAKIYSNPNDITMKNSGTKSAGNTYLGEVIGDPIDAKLQSIRDKHNYQEEGISSDDQKNRKREFREEYIKEFGSGMKKLTETKEGQEQLTQMWKDVHGCGHDVHTLIVNKKTGESQIKDPDHYCDPKPPFDITYDGGKVVINLDTQTDEYVQIDCKTEMNSSPKLLFKHKVKKK